jgi:predicted RND superfamily exporter protein
MNKFRYQIERFFESLVHTIFKYRWFVLCASLIFTGILATQIRHLKVDTSTEAFFFEDDPEIVTYDRFREQFGSAEVAVIAIRTSDVFSINFLEKLRNLHQELEANVPYLDDITSLVNVTATRGEKDELIIEELMKNWTDDPQKQPQYIDSLKTYASKNQLYRNYLLSEDNHYTAIILKPIAFSNGEPTAKKKNADSFLEDGIESESMSQNKPKDINQSKLNDKENKAFVKAIYDITRKHHSKNFSIFVAGQPILSYSIQSRMQRDVPRFTALAVLIIFLLLFFLFRRISGVLLPLTIVIFSMVATFALFGIFKRPFTVITQIIPSFIISVGVCDSVHLLAVFYRRFSIDKNKEAAIAYAMGHSGLAILMTSMTTAGSLLSFAGAKIAPIADLGIYAAAGVILAFLYTIILLPALLAVIPIRQKPKNGYRVEAFFDRILVGLGDFATRKPWYVVAATLVIIAGSALGISRLHFSHNPVAWFPDNDPFRVSTFEIDKGMKGSMTMEAVVETNTENALYKPDIMNRLETFNRQAETITEGKLFVGKSISVADTLKQLNQSLNENQNDYYRIPKNKQLIAQEFLLFENGGTDDLENLVDSRFSKARITIKLPWEDANTYSGIQTKLISLLTKTLDGAGTVTITGMISLLTRTIYNVIVTMMTSYMIAGIVITIMMVFLVGSLKYGLLSMIPNILPILIALGLMGFANMNLDLSNILIGSIVIGLAVDDTVHFFHNFRRYFHNTGNVHLAVRETLLSTGRAMLFTTLVLVGGFALFIVSDMKNLINFGLITSLSMVTALMADLLLAPALMTLFSPAVEKQETSLEPGFDSI